MFVTNWISPTKIQKISEITNFFRHYFLSRTEVIIDRKQKIQVRANLAWIFSFLSKTFVVSKTYPKSCNV